MAKRNKGLGMGLDALLKMNVRDQVESQKEVAQEGAVIAGFLELAIDKIIPNPDQPRKNFDEDLLDDLAQSIKNFGLIQPIVVVKKDNLYEIIAGERRYRAAKQIGLDKIPAIIKDISQKEELEMSLVENIQRENLNAIEEALAYSNLIDTYNITQEELAKTLGKSRTTITNSIRLLNLDAEIQRWIMQDKLTSGHARAVLSINNANQHQSFANYIIQHNLSVREAEVSAKKWHLMSQKRTHSSPPQKELELQLAEEKLQQNLQTKVIINGNSKRGKIYIDYFSQEELERIMELIGGGLT